MPATALDDVYNYDPSYLAEILKSVSPDHEAADPQNHILLIPGIETGKICKYGQPVDRNPGGIGKSSGLR